MTHMNMKEAAAELGLSISWTYRLLKNKGLREMVDGVLHISTENLKELKITRNLKKGTQEEVGAPDHIALKKYYERMCPSCPWS